MWINLDELLAAKKVKVSFLFFCPVSETSRRQNGMAPIQMFQLE
jgi:hypothetical protein